MSYHPTPYHTRLYYTIPSHPIPSRIVSHFPISCHTASDHAFSYHIFMFYYTILHHAMPYHPPLTFYPFRLALFHRPACQPALSLGRFPASHNTIYTIPSCTMPCHTMPSLPIPSLPISCYAVPSHTTPYTYTISFHNILQHIIPYHAMPSPPICHSSMHPGRYSPLNSIHLSYAMLPTLGPAPILGSPIACLSNGLLTLAPLLILSSCQSMCLLQ